MWSFVLSSLETFSRMKSSNVWQSTTSACSNYLFMQSLIGSFSEKAFLETFVKKILEQNFLKTFLQNFFTNFYAKQFMERIATNLYVSMRQPFSSDKNVMPAGIRLKSGIRWAQKISNIFWFIFTKEWLRTFLEITLIMSLLWSFSWLKT